MFPDISTPLKSKPYTLHPMTLMKKKLAILEEDLKDMQIIATYDGIVAEQDASVGDYFEEGDTVGTLIIRRTLCHRE